MVQNIAKLALSFRTKTTLFLAQNDSWHQSWFADPEATEVTEGGDVPTDVSSYLQACKRNNKWFDSFNCFAAAEVLESEVVVFKHLHGQWVYFQKFVPSKCSSKEPIPLFLKNGHFQTIDPSVPLPSHWHDFDPKDVGPALSFLGGGKRAYVGNARGSTTKSAKTGKSDSLYSWFKPQSAKTVKKQVLRRQNASGSAQGSGLTDASPAGSSWFRPQKVTTEKKKKQVPGPAKSSGRSLKASSVAFSKWFRPQRQATSSVSTFRKSARPRPGKKGDGAKFLPDTVTTADDLSEWDFESKKVPRKTKDLRKQLKKDKPAYLQSQTWNCPVCQHELKCCNSASLASAKRWHMKSRHPTFNLSLVQTYRKRDIFPASADLPQGTRAWDCPLCDKGLPSLPYQDYKRAVAQHCIIDHPEHTPKTLEFLKRKNRPNKCGPKNAATLDKKRVKVVRKHQHFLIRRPPHETTEAGHAVFCKVCLSRLIKHPAETKRTCKQNLKLLSASGALRTCRRKWWTKVQSQDPQWAKDFCALSGWTKEAIDALLGSNHTQAGE